MHLYEATTLPHVTNLASLCLVRCLLVLSLRDDYSNPATTSSCFAPAAERKRVSGTPLKCATNVAATIGEESAVAFRRPNPGQLATGCGCDVLKFWWYSHDLALALPQRSFHCNPMLHQVLPFASCICLVQMHNEPTLTKTLTRHRQVILSTIISKFVLTQLEWPQIVPKTLKPWLCVGKSDRLHTTVVRSCLAAWASVAHFCEGRWFISVPICVLEPTVMTMPHAHTDTLECTDCVLTNARAHHSDMTRRSKTQRKKITLGCHWHISPIFGCFSSCFQFVLL